MNNEENTILVDLHDRITEAYYGKLGDKLMRETQKRIHWICKQVNGQKILDVGCSQGILPILLGREGKKVTGLDISQKAINHANEILVNEEEDVKENVDFLRANFMLQDFGDDKFDTIIIAEVLEHLVNPIDFIEKSKSLLTEKGSLIITIPFGINDYIDHKHTYYLTEMYQMLHGDFTVADISILGKWIGFIALYNKSKNTTPLQKIDIDEVKKIEDAFYTIEREIIDTNQSTIKQLNDARSKYRSTSEQITKLKNQAINEKQKYEDKLNEARQKYHKASHQINLLKEQINETEKKHTELQARENYLNVDLTKAKNEISSLKKSLEIAKLFKIKLEKCRTTASFQLGHVLIHETGSIRDLISLPGKIWKIKSKKQLPFRQLTHKKEQKLTRSKPSVTLNKGSTKKSKSQKNFTTNKKTKELKIACIMDPFTYGSYSYEATFLQLTPRNWKEEIIAFSPDLLFIESAWRGKNELWWNTIGKKCNELIEIINYCNNSNIPTVFWNKEDPVHFSTFINTAALFDFVFTTDIDMIDKYKTALQHDNVYLLPFACQPKVNNPIEKYPRKDAFCFAGAYYVRYPHRIKDLDEFMLRLPEAKPIEIYDRNYGKDDPNYMFPDQFKPYIVGTLPFDEIDKAYKSYNYAINLNSVKQSQSMFARRVYEVLASNTVTISNFSRAVRVLFGDLVLTSDSGSELVKRVSEKSQDEIFLKKHKLYALRKVLSEHTYKHRLEYLTSKVYDRKVEDSSSQITMICFVQDIVAYEQCLEAFNKQNYKYKKLLIVTDHYNGKNNCNDVKIIAFNDAKNKTINELYPSTDYIGIINADDFYGANYLTDLAITSCYFDGDVIGKGSYYHCTDGDNIALQNNNTQYHIVNSLPLHTSIIKKEKLSSLKIIEIQKIATSNELGNVKCLSTDEFNYCQNGNKLPSKLIELIEANTIKFPGISMAELTKYSEKKVNAPIEKETECLSGTTLAKSINTHKNSEVSFEVNDESINISSMLASDKHQNIYNPDLYNLNTLGFSKQQAIYLDMGTGLDVMLIVVYLDEHKQKTSHQSFMPNKNETLSIPDNTTWIQFGFRIKGAGRVNLTALELSHRVLNPAIMIGQTEHLILTNHYPSYDDLYRNAFIHSRAKAYQEQGVNTEIFKLRGDTQVSYDEFENIDVITGPSSTLRNLLDNNNYKSILVHFLDEQMWAVLQNYVDKKNIFVWVHGSEIQPWHRRKFNYTTQEELDKAKSLSAKRMKLWQQILEKPHPNLKLIFVSQYFAEEVQEDLKLTIPDENKVIIHNYINTDLFEYAPKDIEQRKKILSIRPYASRNYANDLSVEAILELSNKAYFNELKFHMIGDGTLFDETLEPLKRFSNVLIEKRFLTHSEIAVLHKKYGIFMVPTRADTHGVSRDEAMSSGLIPLTNAVTAIPEFVDEECGILADGNDAHGLAEGIAKIYEHPELFQKMSEYAAKRVRKQCGFEQTIGKELELFSSTHTQKNT
ncbi:MAG: methyltransferase domain-containing protein [Methyloprofundus sp.]|nr:methyltransferase domain-containing protein [Methyloprofundus sp.]